MDRTLTLQPRLRAIADLVPPGSRLADVGTDHGYIPAALLLEGRIAEAIASDIGREPLEHAARTARQWGVADRMELRLCDGLAPSLPARQTPSLSPVWAAIISWIFSRPLPGPGRGRCSSSSL